MAAKKTSLDFERSLKELESLVAALEEGNLTLEESLITFEKGVKLTRTCQAALKDAEQKVHILLERDGELASEPFDTPNS